MLFSEKYKPSKFDDHNDDAKKILSNVCHLNMPHMLIYGPEGSGKLCLIQNWLASRYGEGIHKLQMKNWEFRCPTRNIEASILYSNYHYIINPTLFGSNDKYVLQNFVNSIAETSNVSRFGIVDQTQFKLIVITKADGLSEAAQNALRFTMEKILHNCRLIFLSRNLSKMIDPICSRCLKVSVDVDDKSMAKAAMTALINDRQACLNDPQDIDFLQACTSYAIRESRSSWRRMWNTLQLKLVGIEKTSDDTIIYNQIVDTILKDPDIHRLTDLRPSIYALLAMSDRPSGVFRNLVKVMANRSLSKEMMTKILRLACEADGSCVAGSKPILHVESFVLSVACLVSRVAPASTKNIHTVRQSTHV